MTQTAFLHTLEGALEEVKEVPLWGSPPPFPFERFSKELAGVMDIEGLKIASTQTEYLEKDALTRGMGQSPSITPFVLSPLHGVYYLVLSKSDKKKLLQSTVYKDAPGKEPSDPILIEGFFTTLMLTACATFAQINPFGNVTANLEEETPLPEDNCLCIELAIQKGDLHLPARIIVSKEAHASIKTHFTMDKPPLLSDPSLQEILLPLNLSIGSTTLSAKEWQTASVGDCILLDRCTFDSEHKKGTAQLMLVSSPLFDVRIKEGEIKILDYSLPLEETVMKDETEDNLPEEIANTPSENGEEETPLWSSEEAPALDEEVLASKDIPLSLNVEVGRFKMPLSKLMQLKAGNVLDLQLPPGHVHLTLSGKPIAKGELVKIGEGIGVKILKVGD